jgi:hypothetical protein
MDSCRRDLHFLVDHALSSLLLPTRIVGFRVCLEVYKSNCEEVLIWLKNAHMERVELWYLPLHNNPSFVQSFSLALTFCIRIENFMLECRWRHL